MQFANHSMNENEKVTLCGMHDFYILSPRVDITLGLKAVKSIYLIEVYLRYNNNRHLILPY